MTGTLRPDEVAQFSCPTCLTGKGWTFAGRPARRLNSIVVIARCRTCGGRTFIKKLLPSADEDGASRAAREFATASVLHRAFQADPVSGVARPLGRQGAALSFEFLDGRMVSEVLRSGARSEQYLALNKVGVWFSRFHRIGARGTGPAGLAEALSAVANHCTADARLPPTAVAALQHLRDRIPALSSREFDLVRLHGDAKAENFMLVGSRVVAVDVDGHFTNVGEMDLAQFLVQLGVAQARFPGRIDEDHMDDLESALLDGYAEHAAHNAEVLGWMKIYFWLSFWMSWRRRGPIHAMRLNGLFRRRIEACLSNTRPPAGAVPSDSGTRSRHAGTGA